MKYVLSYGVSGGATIMVGPYDTEQEALFVYENTAAPGTAFFLGVAPLVASLEEYIGDIDA